MTLISVVIPAYRRGHIVPRAIRSALAQTHPDLEVIVVDDGSGDNTESVVKSLAHEDPRLHYLCHETNRGAQAARNTGARAARGSWVAFLDSDDYLVPNGLELRLKAAQDQGVEVVNSQCWLLKADPEGPDQNPRENSVESPVIYGTPALGGNLYPVLLQDYGPLFSGLLVTRDALEAIGYLDEGIVAYQDWDTVIRLAQRYPFGFVAEPTFFYDCRGTDTISGNPQREAEGYRQVFHKHRPAMLGRLGPRGVAHHYRHLAQRFGAAGQPRVAQRYQLLALLWWPFRLKAAYRKLRQLLWTPRYSL